MSHHIYHPEKDITKNRPFSITKRNDHKEEREQNTLDLHTADLTERGDQKNESKNKRTPNKNKHD